MYPNIFSLYGRGWVSFMVAEERRKAAITGEKRRAESSGKEKPGRNDA